ncbi:hypothetical protein TNIN_245271 [Trichonephila inaurata madagascariensis]|uniref:Uncharacterized protein n=1 Tax=Trichonephila inaurata madagascariensis TaxID=2747483 RepID=A0A8X6WRX8_9ARAC|nr:hypothetical protein TNIN_245271 [Trichonephila inaurata madagascariensis]
MASDKTSILFLKPKGIKPFLPIYTPRAIVFPKNIREKDGIIPGLRSSTINMQALLEVVRVRTNIVVFLFPQKMTLHPSRELTRRSIVPAKRSKS